MCGDREAVQYAQATTNNEMQPRWYDDGVCVCALFAWCVFLNWQIAPRNSYTTHTMPTPSSRQSQQLLLAAAVAIAAAAAALHYRRRLAAAEAATARSAKLREEERRGRTGLERELRHLRQQLQRQPASAANIKPGKCGGSAGLWCERSLCAN
jgi:hypothetical protein